MINACLTFLIIIQTHRGIKIRISPQKIIIYNEDSRNHARALRFSARC